MKEKTFTEVVMNELYASLTEVQEGELAAMTDMISPQKRIFCDGAGRSGLQIKGFAMRLIQMGFPAAVVGEPTVPAITAKDNLLICSASGETPAMVAHARKAKEIGAGVLLITANEQSSLASICDRKILIHASSKNQATEASIQPMGSLFEQSVGILLDILVLHLMKKYDISNQDMVLNHANLE
ncbi:MAG: 6-phospho-3-hexuloisomerase [Oliverpabstia sp.]